MERPGEGRRTLRVSRDWMKSSGWFGGKDPTGARAVPLLQHRVCSKVLWVTSQIGALRGENRHPASIAQFSHRPSRPGLPNRPTVP